MNLITLLNLKSITPVLLGGYDTQYSHKLDNFIIKEELRTQSLKGFLRYWFRSYLVGGGLTKEEVLKRTNEIFGGDVIGERGKREIKSSDVRLKSELINDNCSDNLINVPLFKFTTRGNKKIFYASKLIARITLEERIKANLDSNDRKLIVGSLITGLLLSGIGKFGRRGFGSFDFSIDQDATNCYKEISNKIFDENISDENRMKYIKGVIVETRNVAFTRKLNDIPITHAIHPDYLKLIYINPKGKKPLTVLNVLQSFVVRSTREKFLQNSTITAKRLAWYMGLPRSQPKSGTGYVSDLNRRASPLFVSIHSQFTLVSSFLSSDWPNEIRWRGGGKKLKIIKTDKLRDTFNDVYNELLKYLQVRQYEYKEINLHE
jgi:CRISPR type III-B/RAMP module RAMP protein Cmr1